ncbi:MAG TPA: glutathione S-transferase N-terminal domain-containing protein [Burkholderiaceae bacterium]|nr:glutathione S-transferase N-terminal domain-containing protein [Burkholderiaceae bacterium]
MKLYYLPGACPLAAHIVLEWTGAPYELQQVSRTEIKEPAYLKMNPLGAVPVLQNDGITLTQNAAILEYLSELHPGADLVGKTKEERAETRRWLGFCNSDLHRTFSLVFSAAAYVSDPKVQEELVRNVMNRLHTLFGILNDQLKGKTWLTGKRSIADPYLYTVMRWAKGKQVDLAGMADLEAFFQHMSADTGVQAALKAEGLS